MFLERKNNDMAFTFIPFCDIRELFLSLILCFTYFVSFIDHFRRLF